MDQKKLDKFKKMLLEKREALIQTVEEMKQDDEGAPIALDSGDRAFSSYEKELLYQLSDTERKILMLVMEALDRIEKGTYGFCVECSKPIQETRLHAIPWARHCISCQELQEKGQIT